MFRTKETQRKFKKTIDSDESRGRRKDVTVQLRKNKRDEQVKQIRRIEKTKETPENDNLSFEQREQNNQNDIMEKLKAIPKLVQGVMSDDQNLQVECVTHFRKLLSIERNPPIQAVIDSGVVPRLIQFLKHPNNYTLQFEAAWALTNIASGTTHHTTHVIKHGAIPIFVQLLKSQNEDVREQAVWALGNIAGDSHQCRDFVLEHGAMEFLLPLCNLNGKLTMLRNATWTLSNFCRGKPQPAFDRVSIALPFLANLIYSQDDEVLTDACWALSYLSDDNGPQNQKIQAVLQSGVASRLVDLLMHKNPNVKTPALRTVGNIVTGDDLQTNMIMNCNVLGCLLALLMNRKKGIRKEACWTISNITAGNADQIQQVIEANIIPPLVQTLKTADFDIQKEAAWAISNATSGGREDQIRYLVDDCGVIAPLCDLFTCPEAKIIIVAMEGIENILKVGKKDSEKLGTYNVYAEHVEQCRGVDALEALQRHDNEEIYDKAVKIIKAFFESEEETESQQLQPQISVDQNQFQFGMQQPQQPGGFDFSGK